MRRWEFVADGSEKFWEIWQEGDTVTVRFGRIGTVGQIRTKVLASNAAAAAHMAELVAKKEKKGYRPGGAATKMLTPVPSAADFAVAGAGAAQSVLGGSPATPPSVAAGPVASDSVIGVSPDQHATPAVPHTPENAAIVSPAAADEDIWVMPNAWLRDIIRQRGFDPAPEFTLDPAEVELGRQQVVERAEAIELALAADRSRKELVSAARDHLAGKPDPLGAAAVAAVAKPGVHFVHTWIADHGLAFAAIAVVKLMGLRRFGREADHSGELAHVCLQHAYGGFESSPTEPEGRMLMAVRYAIATATVEERAAAEAALEKSNGSTIHQELRSFLLPERADWFAEVCGLQYTPSRWWLVPSSARSLQDFEAAALTVTSHAFVLHTAVYVLGPAIAPLLAKELDGDVPFQNAHGRERAAKLLAALPTDEAFALLLDRRGAKAVESAVLSAMTAFPRRAAGLLAARSSTPEVLELLQAHLLSHPELTVPEEVAALLAASSRVTVPEAGVDRLPPLLVSPPWLNRTKPLKPVVIPDLPAPEPEVGWLPDEREEWLRCDSEGENGRLDWRELLEDHEAGESGYYDYCLFLLAPDDAVRHLLADWQPNHNEGVEQWGRKIAARFGVDAEPALVRHAQSAPARAGMVLLPFATAEVAAQMADWFARSKQGRRWGVEWLERHRERAARLLIPAAAGTAGVPRRNAEAALRYLRNIVGVDVATVARQCGAEAAIDVVLSVDPLDVLPAKLPAIGAWADTRLLPQVLLEDRENALSFEAASHLLMMAALSKPGEPYAGLPIVREALDPGSLATFSWAVFQAWNEAGAPSKEIWALNALGWFGDDSTVRALSPLIRAWPGESQHTRAVAGLDVLADIGTEVALSHLNSIAEKVPFKGLKTRAQEKVAQIAAELGLSREQLSDRLVPRLGLDDAATLVIDYGPRQFTVGFDEHLKPFVLDPDGKRRKDLPKPGAKDDQDKAPLEHKRFTALKKDVRTIASDQVHRLERAMVDQRTWTADEFRMVLAGHPLLWHLVRRLVWLTGDGRSFRLAEDRTPADPNDDEFTLPAEAVVRIAHPVDLQGSAAAWGEVFADYEILQPFAQLGRPVHLASGDLLPRLKKYCGTPYPIGKILGLTKKGWVRGTPQDAGVECWITRPFPNGGALVASLEPGIAVGAMDVFPEVGFSDMWFSPDGRGDWSAPRDSPAVFDLDPITTSELLSEVESLRS